MADLGSPGNIDNIQSISKKKNTAVEQQVEDQVFSNKRFSLLLDSINKVIMYFLCLILVPFF